MMRSASSSERTRAASTASKSSSTFRISAICPNDQSVQWYGPGLDSLCTDRGDLSFYAEVDGFGHAIDPGAVGELPVSPVFMDGGVDAIMGYPDGIIVLDFAAQDIACEGVRRVDNGLAAVVFLDFFQPLQRPFIQEFV